MRKIKPQRSPLRLKDHYLRILALLLLESQHVLICLDKFGAYGYVGVGRDILVLALNELQETGAKDVIGIEIFLGADVGNADEHCCRESGI